MHLIEISKTWFAMHSDLQAFAARSWSDSLGFATRAGKPRKEECGSAASHGQWRLWKSTVVRAALQKLGMDGSPCKRREDLTERLAGFGWVVLFLFLGKDWKLMKMCKLICLRYELLFSKLQRGVWERWDQDLADPKCTYPPDPFLWCLSGLWKMLEYSYKCVCVIC